MLEVTRMGGGLFSFDSVDAHGGRSPGKSRDLITITGRRGDVAVGSTALSGGTLTFLPIA